MEFIWPERAAPPSISAPLWWNAVQASVWIATRDLGIVAYVVADEAPYTTDKSISRRSLLEADVDLGKHVDRSKRILQLKTALQELAKACGEGQIKVDANGALIPPRRWEQWAGVGIWSHDVMRLWPVQHPKQVAQAPPPEAQAQPPGAKARWAPAKELVKETWFNDNRRASEKEAAGFSPMRHPPPLHRPAA